MRLIGDPERFSIAEISALCDRDDVHATRPFVDRLLHDARGGARALGERLARRLEATGRDAARLERMLAIERRWWGEGVARIAGVDEAGMGPLAGPVVAAAVILSSERPIRDANDSKQLSAGERERLDSVIREEALAFAIGTASVEEIDALDIHQAGLLAMRRAVLGLVPAPERVLVDARTIPGIPMPQEAHVRGDSLSCSIAAASILAKVHRDGLMRELALLHPGYGFETHAGYGTEAHVQALRRLGPSPAHRTSWRAVADFSGALSARYYELKDSLPLATTEAELRNWRFRVQASVGELTAGEVRRLDEACRRRARASRRHRDDGQVDLARPGPPAP